MTTRDGFDRQLAAWLHDERRAGRARLPRRDARGDRGQAPASVLGVPREVAPGDTPGPARRARPAGPDPRGPRAAPRRWPRRGRGRRRPAACPDAAPAAVRPREDGPARLRQGRPDRPRRARRERHPPVCWRPSRRSSARRSRGTGPAWRSGRSPTDARARRVRRWRRTSGWSMSTVARAQPHAGHRAFPEQFSPAGSWSPDGSSIAFTTGKDAHLYVVADRRQRAAEGDRRRLAVPDVPGLGARWLPDRVQRDGAGRRRPVPPLIGA